jgi:hypothetical protein
MKLSKIFKSKTMMYNLFLAFLGVLELNFYLIADTFGSYQGFVYITLAMVGAYLRFITTMPIEDKE